MTDALYLHPLVLEMAEMDFSMAQSGCSDSLIEDDWSFGFASWNVGDL